MPLSGRQAFLTVGTAVTDLGKQSTVESLDGGWQGPAVALHRQGQGGCGYRHGRQSQGGNHDSLTHIDLWRGLAD